MTEAKIESIPAAAPRRMQAWPLWKLFTGALIAHLVLAAILSPLFGGKAKNSPTELIVKARALRAEGKHDAAMEAYQMIISQKPPVPAVFVDAEKEMHATRLESLDTKRKDAEKERQQEAPAAGKDGKPAKPAAGAAPAAAGAATGVDTNAPRTAAPAVDLPALPALDGGL